MAVKVDSSRNENTYFSRYSHLSILYNTIDRTNYPETYTKIKKNFTVFKTHIISELDTLDSIALFYYNNPLYWWIIADVNDIQDVFNLKVGNSLQIPHLNQVRF